MSEQETYIEELKTDVATLINQRAKLRETVEKQKLVIDELNKNYLKLNKQFDMACDNADELEEKIETANKILDRVWSYGANFGISKFEEVQADLMSLKFTLSVSQENITEPTK